MPVVTFDFHNTIATCDAWFNLEVRDLPWAVASHLGLPARMQLDKIELDAAYADLRRRVIDSGHEVDAFESVTAVLAAYGAVVDRPTAIEAVDELMTVALSSVEPVEGICETIRHLHERGCLLGVISSAVHHGFVEWSIGRLNVRDAFSSIVTSASAGYYKSSRRIYEHSLRELRAEPGNTVHVGDSLRWDVLGAQMAGMKAIWLNTGRAERGRLAPVVPIHPDLTLTSMIGAGPIIYDLAVKAESTLDA